MSFKSSLTRRAHILISATHRMERFRKNDPCVIFNKIMSSSMTLSEGNRHSFRICLANERYFHILLYRRECFTGNSGAGQKTPEIFVSGSSNKKWRHIRFKPGRAARFTKRKNGVSICQDFLLFATHQVRFLSNWGWEDVAGTFLRLWNWNFWEKTTFHYCFEGK